MRAARVVVLASIAHLVVVIVRKIAAALAHEINIHQPDQSETNLLLRIPNGKSDTKHAPHRHAKNHLSVKKRIRRQANDWHHLRHQHVINRNHDRHPLTAPLFNRQNENKKVLHPKRNGIEANLTFEILI